MDIVFTKHAMEKFALLRAHGISLTEGQIREAVLRPAVMDRSRAPLRIAQAPLDARHVLRVVYRTEQRRRVIITFYPGRSRHYGKRKTA